MRKQNKKSGWVWLTVLLLFVFVAASTFVLMDRLTGYQMNDLGAIELIPRAAASETEPGTEAPTEEETEAPTEKETEAPTEVPTEKATEAPTTAPNQPYNPGFEVRDDNTVWTTETEVEIFRISYENGNQIVTVQGSNGDSVIAPGTDNSYTFKLKNTGNVNMKYTVEVDAYFTPADIPLPVTTRLSRYDAKWIVGGQDSWAEVSKLDAAEDSDTLKPGYYTYYTLDWQWPFEQGNDAYDTYLGNLAVQQDLIFTIVIRTRAEATEGPGGGIQPSTGDWSGLELWLVLEICSILAIIVLVSVYFIEKRRSRREA